MQINTYVSDRRKKQKKRRRVFFAVGLFLAAYFIFLGIFAVIVLLPAFQIERITIQGNDTIPSGQIMSLLEASITNHGDLMNGGESLVKQLFGFKNILIWPSSLPSATIAMIPQLANIKISKDYFLHTVTVTATERQPFAVWCRLPPGSASISGTVPSSSQAMADANLLGAEQCFWFDQTGFVFERTFDTQGSAITVVHDYSGNALVLGKLVLPEEFISNFISIVNTLKQSGIRIGEVTLRDLSLEQIDVTTENGPTLHFSLRFPADDDLPVLTSLMIKPGFSKLQYIDFTVENRAYYK